MYSWSFLPVCFPAQELIKYELDMAYSIASDLYMLGLYHQYVVCAWSFVLVQLPAKVLIFVSN